MPLFVSPGFERRLFAAVQLLAAATLASLLLLGTASKPPGAAAAAEGAPGPIRVVSQGSSIRFGQAVELTLGVEGDAADITAIQTFYRPRGTRTITTYGYAHFTPGRRVTARLTIPTASPTYYPPGVVFEVRYEISDAAGNRIETAPQAIEYLDPGFAWRRLSRENLTAIYHDRSESSINELLTELLRRIPRIESAVGAVKGGEYKAILYNSNAEARKAFPFVSQTATESHVFAGFAYEQYGLLVLDHAGVQGVTHELTHLLFGQATNTPTAKRPAWLNEGLAVYFETGSRSSTGASLAGAIRDDRLLPLRAMNSIPGRPEQIDVFYPEAGNFVGYLVERYEEASMRRLAEGLRDGALPAAAISAAYGVTLDELEAAWRHDIGAKAEPALATAAPASQPSRATEPASRVPQSTPTASPIASEPSLTPGVTTPARPSFTIWWFVAGLIFAAVVSVAAYAVRRTRRGGP